MSGEGGELYIVKSVRVFRENLDIVVAELIKILLPVVVAVMVAVAGLIVSFIFIPASSVAFVILILLTIVVMLIAYIVSAAVATGGFVLFALEVIHGIKSGLFEPFKKAWRVKGRVILIMFVLAIIYSVVAIVLLLPFITELVRMVSSMHGTPSHLQIEELMYMLVKNLVVMTVIMVLMRLFFEPSYIFPFTNWQGALSSVSGSLGKVLSFVSDDPLSFIAFFLLFLFPEVLNYLWFDVFVKNPLFSNLMSLAGFVKTLLVDPLYILALLIYLRDRNDPDVNISDEFLIPPPPPPPQPYQWQSYQPPAVQEPTVEGSVDESSRKESISYSDSEREEG